MRIHVHIERLVLDGIPAEAGQVPRLRAAVEAELGRLLAEQAVPRLLLHGGAVARLSAPTFEMAPSSSPAGLGSQVAGAVHGALGR
jgi:hypothetical protein